MNDYSVHGSHWIKNSRGENALKVYHQGGLDSYCGLYSIFNIMNFLKSKASNDFLGENGFTNFRELLETCAFQKYFPSWPFGGEGLDTTDVVKALGAAFKQFKVEGLARVEERPKRRSDKAQYDYWFAIGAERPFTQGTQKELIGLAAIIENEKDELGHWVVIIGKDKSAQVGISCEPEWDGIVLDSDRGYERWKVSQDGELPRLFLKREGISEPLGTHWVYSSVSVEIESNSCKWS